MIFEGLALYMMNDIISIEVWIVLRAIHPSTLSHTVSSPLQSSFRKMRGNPNPISVE
jgi:hypothetical protein